MPTTSTVWWSPRTICGLRALWRSLLRSRFLPPSSLVLFAFKDRKETTLVDKIDGFDVSQDGKKVLVRDGRAFKLYDLKPEGKSGAKNVSTDGLMVDRVPQQEWVEIFNEVVRRYPRFLLRPKI